MRATLTFSITCVLLLISLSACLDQEETCEPVDPWTTHCTTNHDGPSSKNVPVTISEATQKGFPVYLPSSESLESLDLEFPSIATMKYWDRGCSYLEMEYYQKGKKDNWLFNVGVTNGCAKLWYGQSLAETKLSWANRETAYIRSKDPLMLTFTEPNSDFIYRVWSSESISTTLDFLESMKHVNGGTP